MSRNFPDWLRAYVDYASFSEAPPKMHFFSGVAAIAGALRRRVWIDQTYFRWYPNFYIILVAPPGIVSKSSTAAIAMNILRKVPGVNFGPDVVTWPALVTAFAASSESFLYNEEFHVQCAIILESSEFGNLVNPQDRELIDLLVSLWDSKMGAFKKVTKGSGSDTVENPFINIIACTTPAWIAGNFPEYVIGGGFTSRCIFVYADKKDKFVAYPSRSVPKNIRDTEARLVQDLETIATTLCGPYELDAEAIDWGEKWYRYHYEHPPEGLQDDRFGGYLARKQTHLHKLAMIFAAATSDVLVITANHLELARTMLRTIEADMPKVFSKIGLSEESVQADRFIKFIQQSSEGIPYHLAYQYIHSHFPNLRDFEQIVAGATRAGFIEMIQTTQGFVIRAKSGV